MRPQPKFPQQQLSNDGGYIDARPVSTGSTKAIFAPDNKPIEVFTGSKRPSLLPIV
jgi:hypothetical protein